MSSVETIIIADWNGREQPLTSLHVPVQDRAMFFGDAVYEVIRVYDGKPFLLEEHLRRLAVSLAKIRIEVSVSEVRARILKNLEHNAVVDGSIYVQVSRGTAPRTHAFPRNATANVLIWSQSLSDPFAAWRGGGIAAITTEDLRWRWRDIKSVNLLPNCLAKQLADEAGAQEALLVECDGTLTEGTASNAFIVKHGFLATPPADQRILSGITRRYVLTLAGRLGLRFEERPVTLADVHDADEVFITSTYAEVLAVTRLDGRLVGQGDVGPTATRLQDAFRRSIPLQRTAERARA
jgi:D-alanine transaminase